MYWSNSYLCFVWNLIVICTKVFMKNYNGKYLCVCIKCAKNRQSMPGILRNKQNVTIIFNRGVYILMFWKWLNDIRREGRNQILFNPVLFFLFFLQNEIFMQFTKKKWAERPDSKVMCIRVGNTKNKIIYSRLVRAKLHLREYTVQSSDYKYNNKGEYSQP